MSRRRNEKPNYAAVNSILVATDAHIKICASVAISFNRFLPNYLRN
jgi:hypothetical protein